MQVTKDAHLQRIICQSTRVETADCSSAGRVIGRFLEFCLNHRWVFSGTACMNFDFLQVAGPTDRGLLAQNLEDWEPPALSASVILLPLWYLLHHICIKLCPSTHWFRRFKECKSTQLVYGWRLRPRLESKYTLLLQEFCGGNDTILSSMPKTAENVGLLNSKLF